MSRRTYLGEWIRNAEAEENSFPHEASALVDCLQKARHLSLEAERLETPPGKEAHPIYLGAVLLH